LIAAKAVADGHCCTLIQDTLTALIAEGHLARHVRCLAREEYDMSTINTEDGAHIYYNMVNEDQQGLLKA